MIAGRLYGGILERIAEEVAKMENEKLDEEAYCIMHVEHQFTFKFLHSFCIFLVFPNFLVIN